MVAPCNARITFFNNVIGILGRDHFPKDDVVSIDHFQKDDAILDDVVCVCPLRVWVSVPMSVSGQNM